MENLIKGTNKLKLTRSLVKSAKTNEKRVHVLPYKGKWGVKIEGSDRIFRIFDSKAAALSLAKEKAMVYGNTLVIVHDRDGRIASSSMAG